jgi:hypothetical protein
VNVLALLFVWMPRTPRPQSGNPISIEGYRWRLVWSEFELLLALFNPDAVHRDLSWLTPEVEYPAPIA